MKDKKKPIPGEAPTAEERVERVYFCPTRRKQSFYIPLRDRDGNRVAKRDSRGSEIFIGNKPVYRDILEKFEEISGKPDKILCIYTLRADDPAYDDKFEALEKLRLDDSSWVMDKEMYLRYQNPDAADAKIRSLELEKENSEQADIIARMEKENAALKALIEEKTAPGGK